MSVNFLFNQLAVRMHWFLACFDVIGSSGPIAAVEVNGRGKHEPIKSVWK